MYSKESIEAQASAVTTEEVIRVENEASGDRDASSSDDNDDKEEPLCPLFMEGLPRDFSSNPTLLAIASLLEEDDDDNNKKKESSTPARPVAAPKLGGGKLRSVQNRTRRAAASPYPKQNKPPKKEASMGEAQLFLKLWKL